MQYKLKVPQQIQTTITLPASKSISNRALIIHALAGGKVKPKNLSDCDDTEVMIRGLRDLPEVIDIKAAGTAMRFMTAYLSTTEGEHIITGTERMQQRPIALLVDALHELGADIEYTTLEGYPPLRIHGRKLEGGRLEIPGNVSSQYISALLMIGPTLRNGLELRLTGDIVSRPYIDLTLHVMHEYGCQIEWTDIDTISLKPQQYADREYLIENDWSAASYWYELLAMGGNWDSEVVLPGLHNGSRQGDASVRHMFSLLGVKTTFEERDGMEVAVLRKHDAVMPRFEYDFINQPDLAQTLVAACCGLKIPFHFKGLASLKIKETDRIEALKTELRKLGFIIHDRNDSELFWDGETCAAEYQPVIETYDDHRMAMAFAPLAYRFPNLHINHPEVVSKSYPHFWDDLKKAGFLIAEE